MEQDGRTESEQLVNVPAELWTYRKSELVSGKLTIETAAATYVDKGEDRHCVYVGTKGMEECQRDWQGGIPRMVAFIAAFDGHDGQLASDYCHKGLLPHILSETKDCMHKHIDDGPNDNLVKTLAHARYAKVQSPLDASIINACHRAQARFGMNLHPPTFEDVKKGVKTTRFDNKGLLSRLAVGRKRKPRGGTTALTLHIYEEREDSGDPETARPMSCAVVANIGDCRLLSDDGKGNHIYRQVTNDHRPQNRSEHNRLVLCVREGTATLGKEKDTGTLRVFPGGLAVSRSIGDLYCARGIICTPELHRIPLSGEGTTHRFVIASDGLWDVMTNEEVGKIASRIQKKDSTNDEDNTNTDNGANSTCDEEVIVNPSQAATKLMEQCLMNGGHVDDITLLVVDIRINGSANKDNK